MITYEDLLKQEQLQYSPAAVFFSLKDDIDDIEIFKEICEHIDFKDNESFFKSVKKFLVNYGEKISLGDGEEMAEQISEAETSEANAYRRAEESIIMTINRPAFLIRNDHIDDSITTWWKKRIDANYDTISKTIPSVGRIEIKGYLNEATWVGTGWLIKGTDIIVTNRHVATSFASKYGESYTINPNHRKRILHINIDFKEEHKIQEELEFDILEVLHINEKNEPDIALLRVRPTNSQGKPLPEGLELSSKEIIPEDTVFVVGYPAFDSNEEIKISDFDFQNIPNVKRLAPGEIFPTGAAPYIYLHDCSTWYGNSGSPVIDFSTGKVVGVHYAGSPYNYNGERANWAVKSTYLLELLSDLGLHYPS